MSEPLSPERWQRVQRIFDEVLELEPALREAGLDRLCSGDRETRREVESLLEAHRRADEVLRELDLLRRPSVDPFRLAGTRVSHYELEHLLGAGGMGVVYRAMDDRLKRRVALKFLPAALGEDPGSKARFVHEAQVASALDHPNICTIHEIAETDAGQLFIAMAFYEGETLKAKISRGPVPADEALEYALQIARGLAASHASGIVHRDIKPANVVIADPAPVGGPGIAKILDFGLAKMAEARFTRTGALMGTVDYMSPEHAGGGEVDHRTDIWSLGVLLYEMLAGVRPFAGPNDQMVIYAILNRPHEPLAQRVPDLPPDLAHVVDMCLEKDPDDRYQSMAPLIQDLETLRVATDSGPSTGLRARRRRRGRIRRGVLAGALVAGAGAALALPSVRRAVIPGPGLMNVVVLPFQNLGGDPARRPFVDGLMHSAIDGLLAVEPIERRVAVVPSYDVIEAGPLTTTEAAARFRAEVTITAGVLFPEGRITIHFGRVDTRAESQSGTRRVDVPLSGIAALPDSMVRAIGELLGIDLAPAPGRVATAGGTASPDAYELYARGRGLLLRYEDVDNVDAAIEQLERAIAADSIYVFAHAALGEAYLRKYDMTGDTTWVGEAVRRGRDAVSLDAELASAQLTLGMIYRGTGRYPEAESTLVRAVELHPGDPFAHRELALALYYQDRIDEAIVHLETAIELRPDYGAFHRSLGYMYFAQGRYERAKGPYRRAIDLAPDVARNMNDLAAAHENLGEYEEAAYWYLEATRADPDNLEDAAWPYGNLGGLAYRRRDYPESVRLFERSYRADSLNTAAWENLPDALFQAGRTTRAREVLLRVVALEERALDVNPADGPALDRLARAYARTGQRDRALSALARLEALVHLTPRERFGMARTYEYLGERGLALRHLERALERGLTAAALEFHDDDVLLESLRTDPRYENLVQLHLGESTLP